MSSSEMIFRQTEAGLIPEDWEVRTIGESLQFISGKAHEPYISRSGNFIVVNSKFISTDGMVRKYCTVNLTPARKDDVLMVMSDLPNGRALAKCFLVDESNKYAVNQRVCIFRSKSYDPRYLRYILNRNAYFMAFDDGVQQTHLLNDPIRKCPIALPSRKEQKAIGDVLTNVDDLISTLERLIAKKRSIKQGMMQQLLTGKTRLPGFVEPWAEVSIGDVADIDPETLPSTTRPNTVIDYISLEDVQQGYLLGRTRVDVGSAPSRARRVIRRYDVLFGTVRPNLQSHLLYEGGLQRPVASTGFAVVRAGRQSDPHFIFNLLMSRAAMIQIDRIIAGSNYPAVSSGDVKKLSFTLPLLVEQRAIAKVLTDAESEIGILRTRLDKIKSVKQGIMQELLTGRTRLPIPEAAS
ncbi:restriction endonuclease subunit S [Rhodococcus sp. IEGM 1304]|uniref:restriction endonuclease subunit S n=1 Tax=Rhodococcus TaxID=1827 RepID=UPI0009FBAB3D|nr:MULTISPECIES: restriction endonuclease subunit S [Rhodococcus]MDV8128518.1 restriction endonuclease subunit S [Rhodococcus sp. IEGM 1304]